MFHLAANYGSLGNTANTDVPALDDGILSIRNSHHVPAEDLQLVAALPIGDEVLRMRIANPYLQAIAQPYIVPVQNAVVPVANYPIADYRRNPIPYRNSEEIQYQVSNSASGPTATTVLSWLRQMERPAPTGQPYMLRGTSTTAAVAYTWTSLTMTWGFNLPAGLYSVIGGVYYATNALAFQITFDGMYYRPGGLGYAVEGINGWGEMLVGGMGEWGQFNTISLPRIRVLNASTDATHVIYLNCVRLR